MSHTTIGVVFALPADGEQVYTYLAPRGVFKPGDIAIVEGNNGQYKLVYVVKIDDEPQTNGPYKYKWATNKANYCPWQVVIDKYTATSDCK